MKTALRSYWRNIGLILLLGLIFAAAMGVYTYYYEPDLYESAVGMYVVLGDAQADAVLSEKIDGMLIRDAKQLLLAPEIVHKAEEKLWPDGLDGLRIELEGVEETHFLYIKAYGTDPGLCQRAATAVSVVFMEQMQNVMGIESISVAERAKEAETPVGPDRVLKILLVFVGAFVMLSLLWLLFAPKKSRITIADAQKGGLGLPVLGRISDFRKNLPAFLKNKKDEIRILSQYVNRSTIEDVKTLSIALRKNMREDTPSVVFASCLTDEGKSTLSLLLATELCDQGARVLLVDMDCYAPTLGGLLGIRGSWDLLDYLDGEASLDETILQTAIPNLYFIDNLHAQSSTARMVASLQFAEFLEQMYGEFDYVLFDAPPVSLFADAAVLGSALGGTLLVIAEERLTMPQLRDTVFQLEAAGNRLQGLVFTNVKPGKLRQYRDYEDSAKARKNR